LIVTREPGIGDWPFRCVRNQLVFVKEPDDVSVKYLDDEHDAKVKLATAAKTNIIFSVCMDFPYLK
jgi:hypothetical protein